MENKNRLRVAFIHPDLGIGGAEQLIVNLAIGLKQQGHFVKIYTPHHNPNHCFPETRDGTLEVEVRGNLIPPRILGRFTALCAYLRMILATLYVIFFGGHYDAIIVDQVAVCVPFLRLAGRRTIFYCHFPDKLLCVERTSRLKRLYRLFLDTLEDVCMLFPNGILVNSQFTQEIVNQAFPIYRRLGKSSEILYPAIDFKKFDEAPPLDLRRQDSRLTQHSYFISLNRYERKKNVALSIYAFSLFRQKLINENDKEAHNLRLVIAGGYEARIQENKEHYEELQNIADRQGIGEYVSFKRNISDEERAFLLKNCIAVLYTPEREHFGIVPVEAMYNCVPIIACNSGGPKESVIDQKTGYLCNAKADEWCDRMLRLYKDEKLAQSMGENGKQRVIEMFSFQTFSQRIEQYVMSIVGNSKPKQQ